MTSSTVASVRVNGHIINGILFKMRTVIESMDHYPVTHRTPDINGVFYTLSRGEVKIGMTQSSRCVFIEFQKMITRSCHGIEPDPDGIFKVSVNLTTTELHHVKHILKTVQFEHI